MKNYQSIFAPYMERYLKQKRSLGFKNIGMEYTFTLFDRFALQETVSNACISKELALKWAVQRPNESPRTRYIRIAEINQLSAFLSSLGNESFLSRLPKVQHFYSPYIFSTQQIKEFFEAADSMFLKCRQYDTSISAVPVLFRMLYATGIRLEEALNLRDVDVDVLHKTLFIKGAKNGQDRRIPISV